MMSPVAAGAAPSVAVRVATVRCTLLATLLALVFAAAGSAAAAQISIGPKEVVYTAKQRKSKNLNNWPDGNLGVNSNGTGGYEFYAANASKPTKTTGTLLDPGASKSNVKVYGLPKKTYKYVAGGPVYRDPASGVRLMVYHAEQHYGGSGKVYYSALGMAASTDPNGLAFYDLGLILEPNSRFPGSNASLDIGGGSLTVFDNQLHVYYRDYQATGRSSELAVARAPLADLVTNALRGQGTAFSKYYNGDWAEPGRGGRASALEIGNPPNLWSAVSYNDYLNEVVLVASHWQPAGTSSDLFLATSPDGVNFSPRQSLVIEAGEQMYPTLIGTGPNPQVTGQSFYVYYTDSIKGAWSRWKDAELVRRQVTFDTLMPPVDPPVVPPIGLPPGPETPPANDSPPLPPLPTDWALISGYTSNFQVGTPADGWTYAWNPTGKLGNSASFAPLAWSDIANVYNTTGSATQQPNGRKSHGDDYLQLAATGGHPGNADYLPIAGYTVQEGDGDGLYRLIDSSIRKYDSSTSRKEDGLNVLVYVNDTPLGPAQSVSTSGALASFDRELGELSVGDTIWVMVDPLKTQYYDYFTNFDFSIEKAVPLAQHLLQATTVPEPSAALLLLTALLGYGARRGVRKR